MSTAGARHCADVNGTFCTEYPVNRESERGGDSTAVHERTPQSQASQSAPLATRATMDAETVEFLAGVCGCTVSEFVERYSRG